jgi:hypothetical protein
MEDITIPKSYLRFGINFFGDTSFFATAPDSPHTGFAIGGVGIRMLGELSPTLDALAEFVLEDKGTPTADVEQLAIRWRKGPGELEVGRFHTDIGYWNTAYHHGFWLQTPIERPHIVRFEDDGGLVPVHWVGAQYTLRGKLGDGTGSIVMGLGNGRGQFVDDVRIANDTNDAKGTLLKLRYKAASFEAGVGFGYDLIAPASVMIRPALPDQQITELLGNAYFVVHSDGPIVIAEGYAFRHQASSKTTMTYGAFGLAGYAVTPWFTPYAAVDVIDGADEDPYFAPDPATAVPIDIVEGILGSRFETSTWSALKLELRLEKRPADPAKNTDFTAIVNWSFGI